MSLRLPLVALAALLAAAPATAQGSRADFATGLNEPVSLVQLDDGRVLVPEYDRVSVISDGEGHAVPRADFATGVDRPVSLVQLDDGRVLAVEYDRVSVISDGEGHAVPRADFATGVDRPVSLVQLDDGRVLVAEYDEGRVSVISDGEGHAVPRADFATGVDRPFSLVQLDDGRVLVAEYDEGRVSVISDGEGHAVPRADFATGLDRPVSLVQLDDGRVLVLEFDRVSVISDGEGHAVPRADFATGLNGVSVLATLIQLDDGRVLVAEYDEGRVSVISDGEGHAVPRADFATGLDRPFSLVQLDDGRVLAVEVGRVSVISDGMVRDRRYPMAGTDDEIVFQSDGNLAVYDAGGAFVWGLHEVAPGRWSEAASVVYDAAANRAVVRDGAGALIWEGAPGGGPEAGPAVTPVPAGSTALDRDERYPMAGTDNELVFQSDGNLVVYTAAGGDGTGGFVWGLNEVADRWSEAASVVYDEGANWAVVYDAAGGEIWSGGPGGDRD